MYNKCISSRLKACLFKAFRAIFAVPFLFSNMTFIFISRRQQQIPIFLISWSSFVGIIIQSNKLWECIFILAHFFYCDLWEFSRMLIIFLYILRYLILTRRKLSIQFCSLLLNWNNLELFCVFFYIVSPQYIYIK